MTFHEALTLLLEAPGGYATRACFTFAVVRAPTGEPIFLQRYPDDPRAGEWGQINHIRVDHILATDWKVVSS